MCARSSHPSLHHQRPPTHTEDHHLLLSHEGEAQHHRRRYWLLLLSPSMPPLGGCSPCYCLTFIWQLWAENDDKERKRGRTYEGIEVLWNLSVKWETVWTKKGGWYMKRSESWEANWGKWRRDDMDLGQVWWNSRWPGKDDFRRGCVGVLGHDWQKNEMCVSGVLLIKKGSVLIHSRCLPLLDGHQTKYISRKS